MFFFISNVASFSYLMGVSFEHEHHIKVLEMKLYTLEMEQLHVLQRYNKRGPFREVYEAARGRLQQNCGPEWHAVEPELAERRVKLYLLLCHRLHL